MSDCPRTSRSHPETVENSCLDEVNRFLDKFDIRLKRHFIENENISSKEISDNLNTLEDQSDNMEEIIIEDNENDAAE